MVIKRNYDWDDGQMLKRSQYFLELIKEDITEFNKSFKLIDNAFVESFDLAIKSAKEIFVDRAMAREISIINGKIELNMTKAKKQIQKLFIYVKSAYMIDRNILKIFGKSEFERARNNKQLMIQLLDKAYQLANSQEYNVNLLSAGLSISDVECLDKIKAKLESLIESREFAKIKRQETTKVRIKTYNTVWSFIEQISNASKMVYWDNPTKIKQYLLYPSALNLPFKIEVISYDKQTKTITWEGSNNSLTYELFCRPSDNSSDWEMIYSGEKNIYQINHNIESKMYRCRGVNIYGFGYWSDIIEINTI